MKLVAQPRHERASVTAVSDCWNRLNADRVGHEHEAVVGRFDLAYGSEDALEPLGGHVAETK